MAVHPTTTTFHSLVAPRASLPFRDRAALGPTPHRRLGAAPRIVLSRSRKRSSSSDGFEPSLRTEHSGAPIGSPARRSSASAIDFLTLCHRLKTTKRKGWINQGIDGPESIADHMYRMALMALIADDLPGLDRERCIKIAIVHDIAEAIVGDITPADGVPKEEKSRREQAALDEMCQVLGGGMRAEEIKELWAEYENNSSLEANLVKDFDKVELILQALEYEMEHGMVLDEFFLSTAGKLELGSRGSFKEECKAIERAELTASFFINKSLSFASSWGQLSGLRFLMDNHLKVTSFLLLPQHWEYRLITLLLEAKSQISSANTNQQGC